MRNLKPLSLCVFFFALACERIFIKMHSIESRCVQDRKTIVYCLHARPCIFHWAPEILPARALKGLNPWTRLQVDQDGPKWPSFLFVVVVFFPSSSTVTCLTPTTYHPTKGVSRKLRFSKLKGSWGGRDWSSAVLVWLHLNNNNNVHLSCAHQRPERSHDTY